MRTNGWLSLWRGLVPTLLRDVPFSGIYWTTYELIKPRVTSVLLSRAERQPNESTFAPAFVSGATAGMLAALLTQPFDVVKTHRQMHLVDNAITTKSICTTIVRDHGLAGFFAGLVPRVVKVAPACAIMISTYEVGKAFFEGRV